MSRPKLTPVERFIKTYSFPGTPAAERMERDLNKLLDAEYNRALRENVDGEADLSWFPDEHGHGPA